MIKFIKTTRLLMKESARLRLFVTELSKYSVLSNERDEFISQLIEILKIVDKHYNQKIITVDQSLCEYYQSQFVAGRKINEICERLLNMIDKREELVEISENTILIGKNGFKAETMLYWKNNLREMDRILRYETRPKIKNEMMDLKYYLNFFRYF